ncbi:MAG: hypothetical protein GF308_16855 [Candidatus Heimdallarchaeota archaeon]|nr:hypothetical protein [Candidatus Heimdallarchaeota archaeon]
MKKVYLHSYYVITEASFGKIVPPSDRKSVISLIDDLVDQAIELNFELQINDLYAVPGEYFDKKSLQKEYSADTIEIIMDCLVLTFFFKDDKVINTKTFYENEYHEDELMNPDVLSDIVQKVFLNHFHTFAVLFDCPVLEYYVLLYIKNGSFFEERFTIDSLAFKHFGVSP